MEMIQECKKAKIDILAITETKKKGCGEINIEEHGILYCGVKSSERAEAGVGCVLSPEYMEKLVDWKGINKRIMKITIKMIGSKNTDIIIVYGPGESDCAEEKNQFWDDLQRVYDETNNPVIIMGDLNARVGNDIRGVQHVMGKFGEKVKNRNGVKLIEFCIQNGLVVQNTLFQHKDCHKYTREERGRNEKSIIDYVITEKSARGIVQDVRVYRGAELSTDHYLLIAKIKQNNNTENNRNNKKKNSTKKESKIIKTYKLQHEDIRDKYSDIVTEEFHQKQGIMQRGNLEDKWKIYKNIINEAGAQACGVAINGGTKKRSSWWNEEIKSIVEEKKKLWMKYLEKRTQQSYDDYKQARKRVKEKVKEGKANEWEDFGAKMEEDSKQNQKLFYRVIKSMRNDEKKIKINTIKDDEGNVLMESEEIITRWKCYFEDVLSGRDIIGNGTINLELAVHQDEKDEIKIEEIEIAIKKMKNGKAPGIDNLKAELYKFMGQAGLQALHIIINEAWKTNTVPQEWTRSVIIPLYKKGDRKDCKNYRGISLMCTACKIYESVLEQRLRKNIESKLHPAQSGFRPGYSTQDHIFTIRNLIEKMLPCNGELYTCFIDLEKAFDTVRRQEIWNALSKNNVENGLIEGIKSLYVNTTNVIRANNQESEAFETTIGVRQGGVLSPILFLIFMNEIIKDCSEQSKKISVGYNKMRNVEISECIFADDIVLLATSERNLQHNLNIWMGVLEAKGMRINIDKTKTVLISNEEKEMNISMEMTAVGQVDDIKYLGAVIDRTGKYEEEINNRINKATKLYHSIKRGFINKKEISTKTKMTVYKTIYLPTLLSGNETWVLTEKLEKRLQVAEMKYLRRAANVTIMDKIRNDNIRDKLGIESVQKYIEKSQLRWWGHLKRLKGDRQVKQIWEAKYIGKKRRGRPRMKWDNEVAKLITHNGLTMKEAETLAGNRKNWRRFVHEIK